MFWSCIMSKSIKIKVKAREKNGIVQAKLLVKHPMESGLRKDKNGETIPIHHLTQLYAEYQGNTVFQADFGPGVAKDPFLAFAFKGKSGDEFLIKAIDTKQQTGEVKAIVR